MGNHTNAKGNIWPVKENGDDEKESDQSRGVEEDEDKYEDWVAVSENGSSIFFKLGAQKKHHDED